MPAFLSKDAKAEWKRVEPELLRLGLLTTVDRVMLAMYCEAWAAFARAVRRLKREGDVAEGGNGTMIQHPSLVTMRAMMEKARALAAEFGFSPSARAGVDLGDPPVGEDDDAKFFGPQPIAPPAPAPPKRA